MEMQKSSLVVELSYPDLVINVGEITLGETNRKKLQKTQREREGEVYTGCMCFIKLRRRSDSDGNGKQR